jgi:RNA polymerase sigma-70 factor (ECF subfamily)
VASSGKTTVAFTAQARIEHERAEDIDTARLVTRFQAGEREAFAAIYERYFDRVYGYVRVAFQDKHEAEDAAQQVFVQALEALPRYERRRQPFRAWLFTIVRNYTLGELRKRARLEVVDPAELDQRREANGETVEDASVLEWISDADLLLFTERLPLPQRQVLVLRYTLDLTDREIATVMGRTPVDVRTLQHRALRFLEKRLSAIGRGPQATASARDKGAWQRRLRQAPVLRGRRFAITDKRPGQRH